MFYHLVHKSLSLHCWPCYLFDLQTVSFVIIHYSFFLRSTRLICLNWLPRWVHTPVRFTVIILRLRHVINYRNKYTVVVVHILLAFALFTLVSIVAQYVHKAILIYWVQYSTVIIWLLLYTISRLYFVMYFARYPIVLA